VENLLDASMDTIDFKKKLFQIYNETNKEIYGSGVIELKINVTHESIMFFTRHNRIQALKVLEKRYVVLKQSVDHALFQEFKLLLGKKLKERLELVPKVLLRDYDPGSKIAVTVVLLKDNLSDEK
jgi:hypothetical protein